MAALHQTHIHTHTVKQQHPPHADQRGTHMMVVKLSFVRIISAASLHTSVPTFPIAMPMSALFSAIASLVPSPVMATTLPTCCKACGDNRKGKGEEGGEEGGQY